MAIPTQSIRVRVAELGGGLEVWKVHIDALRERDVNARIMAPAKFERLTENIRKQGRLESLPLVHNTKPDDPATLFNIMSGHHRTRAALKAGITEIFVLVDTTELTESDVTSKQLAHNALSGYDNDELLAQLYHSIEDLDARIASGIVDKDLKIEVPEVKFDNVTLNVDFEICNILFTPSDFKQFEELMETLTPASSVYIADKLEFDRFADLVIRTGKFHKVVNIAAVMKKMMDLAEEQLCRLEAAPVKVEEDIVDA